MRMKFAMKRLVQIPMAISLVAIGGSAFAQQAPVSGPPVKPPTMEEAKKRMSARAGYYWYSTMRSTHRYNTDPLGCGYNDWNCFDRWCKRDLGAPGSDRGEASLENGGLCMPLPDDSWFCVWPCIQARGIQN
jgi:hypothetical protein